MNNFFIKKFSTFVLVSIILMLPVHANAQMFSIGEPEQRTARPLGSATIFGVAWDFADFTYQAEGAEDFQRLDYSDSLIRLFLISPGLDISLAFGGSFTGMNDHSAVNLNARLYNNLFIQRRPNFQLAIPIQLTTDLMQVRRNETSAEFQQSSLIFGTGAYSAFRLGDRFSFNLKATPNYGFSFSQGSLFGGGLFRFDSGGYLMIDRLFGDTALSIGYNFDYRAYRIEGDLNDYDFTSHSISLGIAF
ncbi:MAG: hypothetical protein EA391_12435 [Balneolaceae bacterium]|nr:MAG: hypothetical protein EA391_12435 [Balneolaceae bacterium]